MNTLPMRVSKAIRYTIPMDRAEADRVREAIASLGFSIDGVTMTNIIAAARSVGLAWGTVLEESGVLFDVRPIEDAPTPDDERMTRLAETFPELRGLPGIRPWDASRLEVKLHDGDMPTGRYDALLFVLAVWSHRHTFDMFRALETWDMEHRAAFSAWAAAPWWL